MLKTPWSAHNEVRAVPVIVVGATNGSVTDQVVEMLGVRIAARLGWDEADHGVADHAAGAVLMIEAEGVGVDTLARALPPIDAAAALLGLPVVIAFDLPCLDVVAASLSQACVQLLCAPALSDRLVALAVAAEQRGALLVSDVLREGEAARLHRLNEEVARIAEVLAKLTRRDHDDRTGIVSDHPTPFRQDPMADVAIDPAEVRRAIRARRLRDQHFGSGLFEDPAWDILLDLFAADLEGAQVSVSSLCIAASVAPTTALRWIAKLTDGGLLERHPDPFDRRRAFMELSPVAARAMRAHVAGLRRAGLPFS